MKISLSSIPVRNQQHALRFYTDILGFSVKTDIPMGEFRWLTVVSPAAPEGAQLVLEPNAHPAAKAYQDALRSDSIPITAFEADDLASEFERLSGLGVKFSGEPTDVGTAIIAMFEDTCGNLIQIYEEK